MPRKTAAAEKKAPAEADEEQKVCYLDNFLQGAPRCCARAAAETAPRHV